MSGAPPGYNPSDSLLSGGTSAQIHPVMGGGGAAPDGYNSGSSMLSGGEGAQIHPVMGGGDIQDGGTSGPITNAEIEAALGADTVPADAADAAGAASVAEADDIADALAAAGTSSRVTFANNTSPEAKDTRLRSAQQRIAAAESELTTSKDPVRIEALRQTIDRARQQIQTLTTPEPTPTVAAVGPDTSLKGEEAWIEYYSVDATDPVEPIYRKTGDEKDLMDRKSGVLKDMMTRYATNQKKLWQRKRIGPAATVESSANSCPKVDQCPAAGSTTGSLKSNHRLVKILPISTKTVLVIPPLKGSIDLLNQALDLCAKYEYITETLNGAVTIRSDCQLVFAAPIFAPLTGTPSDDMLKSHELIWYTIMQLNYVGEGRVSVLSDNTQSSVLAGCFLNMYGSVSSHSATSGALPLSDSIIPMLEPTYVLYPYPRGKHDGLLFTAAAGGEPDMPAVKGPADNGGGTYFSAINISRDKTYTSPFYAFNPELTRAEPGVAKYKVFRCFDSGGPGRMQVPNLKVPADGDCAKLLSTLPLDQMPAGDQFFGPATVAGAVTDVLTIFRLRPESDGITGFQASCQRLGAGLRTLAMSRLAMFTPLPGTVPADQSFKTITIGPKLYDIRLNAKDAWIRQQFTESEAELLNDLNLRPHFLEDIFPLPLAKGIKASWVWQKWLAEFLTSLTASSCFSDTQLLTNRECENARTFVNAVYNYFLVNDARLAETFNTEDAALQDTEMFLRERRSLSELSALKEAMEKQRQLGLEAAKDPVDGEAGNLIIVAMDEGQFGRDKKWGDVKAEGSLVPGLGGVGYWVFPMLIVSRKDGRYYIKGLRSEKTEAAEARADRDAKVAELQAKYPGWSFFV